MKENLISDCDSCGSEEQWFVHNIRHIGMFRRLCTSCVLKFNSGSFCTVCFQIFDLSSLPEDQVFCSKCPSVAHINCTIKDKDSQSVVYTCPPCSNPSFSYFDVDSSKNKFTSSSDGNGRRIDVKLAKALVAAAQIALLSIGKAVTGTRFEAQYRLKEAAVSRKRASEALERLLTVSGKANVDEENERETIEIPNPNPSSVTSIIGEQSEKSKTPNPDQGTSVNVDHKKKKSKTLVAIDAAVAKAKLDKDNGKADGNKKSKKVSKKSVNNVVSAKKKSLSGGNSSIVKKRKPNNDNRFKLQSSNTVNGSKSNNLTNSHTDIVQEHNVSNGNVDSSLGATSLRLNQDTLDSRTDPGVSQRGSTSKAS